MILIPKTRRGGHRSFTTPSKDQKSFGHAISESHLRLSGITGAHSVADTMQFIGGGGAKTQWGSGGEASRKIVRDHALQTLGKHGQRPF